MQRSLAPMLVIIFVFMFGSGMDAALENPDAKCAIMNFEQEFDHSKAVFIGKVLRVEKVGDTKIFEFEVMKYWKGVNSKHVKVSVYENVRFQAQFKKDERFLVFAKVNEEGGLIDGRCSRSRNLDSYADDAKEDLEKLGEGQTRIPLTGETQKTDN